MGLKNELPTSVGVTAQYFRIDKVIIKNLRGGDLRLTGLIFGYKDKVAFDNGADRIKSIKFDFEVESGLSLTQANIYEWVKKNVEELADSTDVLEEV